MLGLQKQGKTLFFRDLMEHMKHSTDTFVTAPGTKGLVMVVFTCPSFPYVFKVIRDWFEPPKQGDRRRVEEKYLLVKYHDRVGRMADTLEYSQRRAARSIASIPRSSRSCGASPRRASRSTGTSSSSSTSTSSGA